MIPISWTAEREQILREKFADHSATAIGIELGVSRNTIIGKARRLGLVKAGHNSVVVRQASPIPVRRLPKVQPIYRAPKIPINIPEVEFVSLNISIGELDASFRKCRWPIDGEPMTYCGHENVKDKSFCPHHCAMAYDKWAR